VGKGRKAGAGVLVAIITSVATSIGMASRCSDRAKRPDRVRVPSMPIEVPYPPKPITRGRTQSRDVGGVIHRGGGVLVAAGLPVRLVSGDATVARTRTDRWGRFHFRGIRAGRFELAVDPVVALGGARGPRAPVVPGSDDAVLELNAERTLVLYGEPAIGREYDRDVRVASRSGGGRAAGTWRGSDAVGLIAGTSPGRSYDVLVRSPTEERAALLKDLPSEATTYVTLGPAQPISGRVTRPAKLTGARIHGTLELRRLRIRVDVDEDGRFEVPALPEGTRWRLTFTAWVGNVRFEVASTAEPGEEVDLALPAR
jgi:hypothetical protein